MKLTTIFKRLILANFLIYLFFILSPFIISESLKVTYFNNSVDPGNTFFLFVLIWIIASLVNLYLLYNFKKPGKQMFLYIFIASLILSLFGGPVASDPIFYIIDGLGMAVSGVLLFMLYYTPISKKF
tara:strand:- start:722 stop:1102 length:381 start_codon:yes stop_codon:yes gene_type:complete